MRATRRRATARRARARPERHRLRRGERRPAHADGLLPRQGAASELGAEQHPHRRRPPRARPRGHRRARPSRPTTRTATTACGSRSTGPATARPTRCAWSSRTSADARATSRCTASTRATPQLDFSFKAGCPTDLDCAAAGPLPAAPLGDPDDRLPRQGLRQLPPADPRPAGADHARLAERHVPDLGIALVELLAYVGDYLSYYQDAVATEAYLDTARRRISVRRHRAAGRLPAARGLQRPRLGRDLDATRDLTLQPGDYRFITAAPPRRRRAGRAARHRRRERRPTPPYEVVRAASTHGTGRLRAAHNDDRLLDLGRRGVLPATRARRARRSVDGRAATPEGDAPQARARPDARRRARLRGGDRPAHRRRRPTPTPRTARPSG